MGKINYNNNSNPGHHRFITCSSWSWYQKMKDSKKWI
uniref:Uncharacterized protein n=1 Tax=Anguilla anguilla TaxID=7936 RepID=A0A0E9SGT6_ANGAN